MDNKNTSTPPFNTFNPDTPHLPKKDKTTLSHGQWDYTEELLAWFSSIEPIEPPLEIANICNNKTKMFMQDLSIYFNTYKDYQFCYRMLFAHYVITNRIWTTNPYLTKYNVPKTQGQIITTSSDGSSSASAFMFKSIQNGDFFMADLMTTPFGVFVYEVLEQMRMIVVSP